MKCWVFSSLAFTGSTEKSRLRFRVRRNAVLILILLARLHLTDCTDDVSESLLTKPTLWNLFRADITDYFSWRRSQPRETSTSSRERRRSTPLQTGMEAYVSAAGSPCAAALWKI